eukprot:COSAG02_NODE_237_length_27732_cov_9.584374_13_plen_455_part_00
MTADKDANLAESFMLVATLMLPILALGQDSLGKVEDDPIVHPSSKDMSQTSVIKQFNIAIYVCIFAAVLASLVILLRRIAGVCFNIKHQSDFETTKIVFKKPSKLMQYRFVATALLRRLRSAATCGRIDCYRYGGSPRTPHADELHTPLIPQDESALTEERQRYMATQRTVMYSSASMEEQIAIIDAEQIIYADPALILEPQVHPDHSQVVVKPQRMHCQVKLGPLWHIDGWVYLKSPPTVDEGKLTGREFNTLFIRQHDELHHYYRVNRTTGVGTAFEVAQCQHGRSAQDLEQLGRSTVHMSVDTVGECCCCCDFTLQKDDVVQVVGLPRADPDSCSCGGTGPCSTGGHCGGQMRLQVVGPTGDAIGWISDKKEHVLCDDVRAVLHKSKLNVAQVWAVAHAEAEDFRRAERLFQGIRDFEQITAVQRMYRATLSARVCCSMHCAAILHLHSFQ